jgi:prevent-host-death family protein
MTKHWALQDAKARLSELVRASAKEPQHITVRGEPASVVISVAEYDLLTGRKKKSGKPRTLLEVLQSAPPGFADLELPSRKGQRMRKVEL